MGKETSERIQTSFLNAAEKRALIWLAQRQPRWMTSDILTYIGVMGSVLFVVGCVLANSDIRYLWLASLGLVIHWYGDSLDGTLARVRNTQRPTYGFFIDHTFDVVTTVMIFLGVGFSPMFRMDVSLLALAGYLSLSIYTYICTILKNEFRLTYAGFGPTEFRLLLILMNILCIYTPWWKSSYDVCGYWFGVFDFIGLIIAAVLFTLYLSQFVRDGRIFVISDPLKPYKPEK